MSDGVSSATRGEIIRDWVTEKITLIGDNDQRWYWRLRQAAKDGWSVSETLRDLIDEHPDVARELLIEVLDLSDSTQEDELAEHYRAD